MRSRFVKSIVIVGGGTAGWMAAAAISEKHKEAVSSGNLSIKLIESSQIATVGVGEATVPGILSLHQHLGISEREFIKATGATFKLGIEFRDWYKRGYNFFHPFAAFGVPIENQDFHQCWLKLYKEGFEIALEEFCLAIAMAKDHRFAQPDDDAKSSLALYSYAYHFDASRYAAFLRAYAEKRGVIRLDAKVEQVKVSNSLDGIESIILDNGGELGGDLFIDCTGFRALLIEGVLRTDYENWQEYLPCDKAVAVQSELIGDVPPFTRSTAMRAGWRWQIPLQHRMGNGYVYCSEFCSDEEAQQTLLSNLEGNALTEPRIIEFKAGMRKQFWKGNCVSLGLASGFIEPLESTSISLIQTGVEKILQFLPGLELKPALIDEANKLNRLEYERIRDFIILHYYASKRDDSPFWNKVRKMEIPDSLKTKIEAFEKDGTVVLFEQESFIEQSWIAMFNGFNRVPGSNVAGVEALNSQKLRQTLERMRSVIKAAAECAPGHAEFLSTVYE